MAPCCSLSLYLVNLKENGWKAVNLVQLLELHTASECQHPPVKELALSEHGGTLTPLLFSIIEKGDLGAVKILIEDWGVGVNAALAGDYSVSPRLSDWSLTFTNVTPLFAAAWYKHNNIVRYLVGQGADTSAGATVSLNDGSSAPLTPLHAAFLFLEKQSTKSMQLDIIRFLVESGADPSVLSATIPFLSMMVKIALELCWLETADFNSCTFCNPNAIYLLIELGMSVTQKCPESGRTVLHFLAAYWRIRNMESFIQLILDKGGDLEAQDNLGITPIMCAVIGDDLDDNLLNFTFLDHMLEREEISTKSKIDALEVAAACILRETDDPRFPNAVNYLMRARNLRTQENLILVPQTPREGRVHEWITSAEQLDIKQHQQELQMQSILIRLRIFSAMNWQVVDRYLWGDISYYIDNPENFNLRSNSLLDISWTVLETIGRLNLDEEGMWSASFEIVDNLVQTLKTLRFYKNPLYSIESVKTTFDLVSKTCPKDLDVDDSFFFNLVVLISFLAELLPTDSPNIIESVRHIVSKKQDQDGQPLYCGHDLMLACLSGLNRFAVIKLLLENEADPHVVDGNGWGALHHLAYMEADGTDVDKIARLLLEWGVHLDRVDKDRRTPVDIYSRTRIRRGHGNVEDPTRINLPNWLQEGVPKLECLCARVLRRHNISHSDPSKSLPSSMRDFVDLH